MNITVKHFLVLLVTTSLGTTYVNAQQTRPAQQRTYDDRPTVSPYLRLAPVLTADNQLQYIDGAYQNYVRPQIQQRKTYQNQQSQLTRLRSQLDRVHLEASLGGQPLQTGHQSRFQSYSHFYPQIGVKKR